MAKRYTVTQTLAVGPNTGTGSDLVVDGTIDIPLLLSQRLQRNVRQGHSFNIHKAQFSLQHAGTASDEDVGLALVGSMLHCPTTKNSARAWRTVFANWRKQKMLKVGALGPTVRFDDLEFAWSSGFTDSRTSTIFTTGLEDSYPEDLVIYGDSVASDSNTQGSLSLEDTFESLQRTPQTSLFPLGGTVKDRKWTQQFPEPVQTPFVAHFSTNGTETHAGATAGMSVCYPMDKAALCGVVRVFAQSKPLDTINHLPDDMTLKVTLTVSIGQSLATVPTKRSRGYTVKNGKKRVAYTHASRKRIAWRTYRKRS